MFLVLLGILGCFLQSDQISLKVNKTFKIQDVFKLIKVLQKQNKNNFIFILSNNFLASTHETKQKAGLVTVRLTGIGALFNYSL